MFGSRWDKGEATIVARNALSSHSSDGTPVYEFVGDVRVADRSPFRATIQTPRIATDFWDPRPRDVVGVLVRLKDSKVKFDKDDARLSFKAYQARQKQAFDDVKTGDVKAQEAGAPDLARMMAAQLSALQDQPGADPATRLGTLAKLHALGLLTDAELAEQRQRILDEI
jgi:hypothetical protein